PRDFDSYRLIRLLDFDALLLQKMKKVTKLPGALLIARKYVSCWTFAGCLRNGSFSKIPEHLEKVLAVVRHLGKGEEDTALCVIDVVPQRPFHLWQRGIGPEPGAVAGVANHTILRFRHQVSVRFVETANGIVTVRNPEHIVGRPAVIESLSPDTGQSFLGQNLHFVVGHPLPFI